MPFATVQTIGQAEVNEQFEFVTDKKFNEGDQVSLKPQKPKFASVYGTGRVLGYLGPAHAEGFRRYAVIRIS